MVMVKQVLLILLDRASSLGGCWVEFGWTTWRRTAIDGLEECIPCVHRRRAALMKLLLQQM